MHEESIRFEAEIAEVGRDPAGVGWDLPDVFALADLDIAEMARGDDDPVFAELMVLKEGIGTGRPGPKRYTAKAVEDCARLLPDMLWGRSRRFRELFEQVFHMSDVRFAH